MAALPPVGPDSTTGISTPRVTAPGVKVGKSTYVEQRRRIGEKWYTPYLFLLPHFFIFTLLVLWPLLFGLWISTQRFALGAATGPVFVGLDNWAQLFSPASFQFERFWMTVWNTVLFVLMSTPTLVIASVLLAALLNQSFRGRTVFRTLFFAPWTLSVAVVGLLWWWMLNQQAGLVNHMLGFLGINALPWLTANPWAWMAILIATLWWTIGFNTIILLAGMQGIPGDLYEAASIDGASRRQQFRHITIPMLRPVLLLVITLQIIASFNLLGQPQIMTGGGPAPGQTTPVMLHIYNTGFTGRFDLGLAAAMALVVAAIMVAFSVINFRFFRSERA
jgi:multiple sugar transport system permease protein